jgi:ribosomal protein S15P/S13E
MAKGSSKQVQGKYGAYKTNQTCKINQTRKINKHLKAHPNDEQSRAALKNAGYKRKAAVTRQWTSPKKEFAKLVASIIPDRTKVNLKGMFSIETRANHNA